MVAATSADAAPKELAAWLEAPGTRLVVVRAAGADYRWRDLPQPPGLRYVVVDGPDVQRWSLAPSSASAWTWQGAQVVDQGGVEDIRAAIGRHLGPKPRVWIDTRNASLRTRLRQELVADGRWVVTFRHGDIQALRAGKAVDEPCPSLRPPRLSLLRIQNGQASWYDPFQGCRSVQARGTQAKTLLAGLMTAWRSTSRIDAQSPLFDDRPPASARRSPPPRNLPAQVGEAGFVEGTGPASPRRVDRHLEKAIRDSRELLSRLNHRNSDPRLYTAAGVWLGARYLRDGKTAMGVDDIQLVRKLHEEVYGTRLSATPLDWLQQFEKVPIDESDPARTLKPGDILFKVTLSYRPREVSLYLGEGLVVGAKEVIGVVVAPVAKNLPETYFLVARRPSRPAANP